MGERSGGPVAPGVAEGAQEFFRKRKRSYYRAEKRGDMRLPVVCWFIDRARERLIYELNKELFK